MSIRVFRSVWKPMKAQIITKCCDVSPVPLCDKKDGKFSKMALC